ncbi:MAG: type II toxin-antitoxin system RatA family toxin [Rickettsiales bacterium]|nr:type II toxin-antitoxin system RatA family toxin [Rickettsiales bacterium]
MPKHFNKIYSKHKAEKVFQIIADVEKYPEFLPWVAGARILERNQKENYFIAELLVHFKMFSHKYSSKVSLSYPNEASEIKSYKVKTDLVSGPFKHLHNNWIVTPANNGETEIIFELDFKFENMLLEKLIGGLFDKATKKMTDAFLKRADSLII